MLGAFRTTPIHALDFDSNLHPVQVRLDLQVSKDAIRLVGLPDSNPAATLARRAMKKCPNRFKTPLHTIFHSKDMRFIHRYKYNIETISPRLLPPWYISPIGTCIDSSKEEASQFHDQFTNEVGTHSPYHVVVYSDGSLTLDETDPESGKFKPGGVAAAAWCPATNKSSFLNLGPNDHNNVHESEIMGVKLAVELGIDYFENLPPHENQSFPDAPTLPQQSPHSHIPSSPPSSPLDHLPFSRNPNTPPSPRQPSPSPPYPFFDNQGITLSPSNSPSLYSLPTDQNLPTKHISSPLSYDPTPPTLSFPLPISSSHESPHHPHEPPSPPSDHNESSRSLYFTNKYIAVFLDSQSAIHSLDGIPRRRAAQHLVMLTHNVASSFLSMYPGSRADAYWIPGHSDIEGNETVDKIANENSQNLPETPPFPQSLSSLKTSRSSCLTRVPSPSNVSNTHFQNRGSLSQSATFDFLSSMSRKACSTFTQLRSEHVALNHYLHRFLIKDSPRCLSCDLGPPETVSHYLLRCHKFAPQRRILIEKCKRAGQRWNKVPFLLSNPTTAPFVLEFLTSTARLPLISATDQDSMDRNAHRNQAEQPGSGPFEARQEGNEN